jgi:hypothetical protein
MPATVVALQFDLAGIQPAAHRDAEQPHLVGDRRGATHRAPFVEGREKAVAEVLDRLAAKASDLLSRRPVLPLWQRVPLAVADFGGALRGSDDIAEQHRRQNPVRLYIAALAGQKLLGLTDDAVRYFASCTGV